MTLRNSALARAEQLLGRAARIRESLKDVQEIDELFTVQTMSLSDRPIEPVDALWFFGRARGDTDNLFELVTLALKLDTAQHVVINGSDGERQGGNKPGEAWEGKTVWTQRLKEFGVERVHYCRPAMNTKEEGDEYLTYSLAQGWETAAIVCQPHQAVRAMLGLVETMTKRCQFLRVYVIAPDITNWFRPVFGSQGHDELPRYLHIQQELMRIRLYQARGDLCSFADLLEYYRNRASVR